MVVRRAELVGCRKKEPLEVVLVPAALPLRESPGEIGMSHANFFTAQIWQSSPMHLPREHQSVIALLLSNRCLRLLVNMV